MIFLVCLLEFWIRYMCIYLSCCDRSMSEELLNNTYICSICQKRSSKTMSKRMSMHIFEDACFESIILYHIRNKKSSKSNGVIIKEWRIDICRCKIMPNKKWNKMIITWHKICLYRITSLICEIYNSEFSSLSSNCKFHGFKIYIIAV